ncbi:MAG: insulinase family protein [Burkholderiaceae bacterium]|nr:insulinase family protein [Burkholderiaceae bacterium]MCD8516200.1 insulinase family protein [Burkholderiaceae bacterium]MCD8536764.1 insulinase family protein [Burkholderiaceae bacterium]MCD8566206.1 insulinase family protein [Burkholderiaceae bacterium]
MTRLKSISHWVVTLTLTVLFLPVQALNLPPGVEKVTEVEGISEYRIDSNGFRFLLAPDNAKPSVTVNMTYLVGSRHENYGQTGMAHLLEHMIFKGTPTTRNALAEFSKRGLRANGTTSEDRTNYFATFAANPETLDWYIRWQADAMINSIIAREDLDSEMTVVRNEMERGENSPFRMLYQKTHATAFEWHNYGKSVIGARSDVEGVDIDQLRDFYRIYYQPDNAVLMVAGKFDPQQVVDTIADAFGPIPKPTRMLPREYTVEPVQDGERRITLRRSGGTPLAAAVYRIPSAGHPDYPALELATMMLSDTPSGRLYKALVPTELASDVFGFARDMYGPGTVMFGAELKPGMDPEKALVTMTQTLETLRAEPFTEEELNRARSQWMNSWDELYSNIQRMGVAISEPIAHGDWRLMFKNRDRIKEVKLQDVQRVVDQYFVAANRTEGLYIPTESPVRAPVKERFDIKPLLEGYIGDIQAELVEAFDATPANIDRLTDRRMLNLPSGPVKMALLNKPTRGQRVQANIVLRFGDLETLKGKATVSTVTAGLLDYGTDTMTRQQIRDRLEELNADMGIGGNDTDVSINISTTGANLPAVIDLALHVVKHANFPEKEINEYITQSITSIKSSMAEPGALASRALARYESPWPRDDVRYVPTFEEAIAELEAIKRSDLASFHNTFYGGGNISVAVVGAFEPQAVIDTVTNSLKDWRRAPKFERIPYPYQEVKPTLMRIDTPDKANAVYLARLSMPLQDTDPDYPALVMGNYLLGASSNSRLWMRIRETDGLSYDVRSMLSASAFEPSADWTFSGIFAPLSWDKFDAALNEELNRALTEGFTDAEVAEGVQSLINLRELNRAQDGILARSWINYLDENRTFAWSAEFDQKLRALDAQAVNAAIRKYLKPENLVQALAGDFKAKEKAGN